MPDNSNIDEILFKLRTTHEVEHNDNQWTTEFVYTIDEAKQAIQQELLKARIDELEHIEDKHKVRLWFDGFYGVDDRITNLQAKLKGDE